ncbi:Potassium transport protein 1 [Lasiodiplodia theobromae]|uniref:Potassium transport protein 1 n=1 Tax=Lasiodiplodia theobromae TaxID=45133 RepID=A0A5N5DDC4_9PEZI|nr:Potassium transport protein 1 [Lasiodiplodia theobromae]
MTTTGLNTVNLGSLSGFQQAILCILLIIGNVPFVSSFVVIIRRHFFRRKLADIVQHSRSGRQMVRDLEGEERQSHYRRDATHLRKRPKRRSDDDNEDESSEQRPLRSSSTPAHRRNTKRESSDQRLYHYATGRGFFPWPWESHTVQRFFHYPFRRLQRKLQPPDRSYISFDADLDERGRFRNLSEHERAELGGVEYRALDLLLPLLLAYQLFWYALGAMILVPYAYRDSISTIIRTAQPGNLSPGWWAFFAVTTSFSNGGLNLLNANFIPFSGNALILIVCGALTIAGNTQFPILLRLAIWTLSRACPATSRLRQACLFLLYHPRRCFIYLFPSKETWYLFAIQVSLDLAMWLLYELLNIGMPDGVQDSSSPLRVRILDGLFQATGLRNSGAYVVTIASLAPALLVAYLATMYISSFPIVMALRQTNTYEERSVGLSSSSSSPSPSSSSSSLGTHLRHQLAYDLWFQLLAWFLISIIERPNLLTPPSPNNPSPFTLFTLLFETTSAYGTVGLSTSIPQDSYSLSGAFQTSSKLVVLAVMLRGRHRGLPLAVDRSILLPGEALMRRMDAEYDERGWWSGAEEAEVRRAGGRAGCSGEGEESRIRRGRGRKAMVAMETVAA